MLTLVTAALLTAAPAPLQVAAPGLSSAQIDPEMVQVLTDQLCTQLGLQGLHVLSSAEIATLLGLERQKQLLGCSDAGCTVELGQALGAEGVLVGSVGRFGQTYQLTLKILSAQNAAPLALYSGEAPNEEALPKLVNAAAKDLAQQANKATGRAPASATAPATNTTTSATGPAATAPAPAATPAPATPPQTAKRFKTQPTSLRTGGLWTMVAGGAVTAAGLVVILAAPPEPQNEFGALSAGALMFLVGATAAVTGLVLYLVGGDEKVAVGLVPMRDGFTAALTGRF